MPRNKGPHTILDYLVAVQAKTRIPPRSDLPGAVHRRRRHLRRTDAAPQRPVARDPDQRRRLRRRRRRRLLQSQEAHAGRMQGPESPDQRPTFGRWS